MSKQSPSSSERRSFLTYLKGGVAALAVGGPALAQEKSRTTTRFEPARHDKDDWLDEIPGKHRLVFDTSTPDGVGDALRFANNFLRVNRTDYGLQNSDLAVLIIVRHRSAPFGYKDAIWSKYGPALAQHAAPFEDPKTKTAPKLNIYNSAEYFSLLSSAGATLESLSKSGVQFGVCSSSTHGIASAIARESGGKADAIYDEIAANLITNARLVPAGIVAVNRAQERGYTLART